MMLYSRRMNHCMTRQIIPNRAVKDDLFQPHTQRLELVELPGAAKQGEPMCPRPLGTRFRPAHHHANAKATVQVGPGAGVMASQLQVPFVRPLTRGTGHKCRHKVFVFQRQEVQLTGYGNQHIQRR